MTSQKPEQSKGRSVLVQRLKEEYAVVRQDRQAMQREAVENRKRAQMARQERQRRQVMLNSMRQNSPGPDQTEDDQYRYMMKDYWQFDVSVAEELERQVERLGAQADILDSQAARMDEQAADEADRESAYDEILTAIGEDEPDVPVQ